MRRARKWGWRIALLLVVVGLVVGHHARAKAATSTGHPARMFVVNGELHCWPVAVTTAQQHQGLQGVAHPRYPLVFVFGQPQVVGFWMHDTPSALTGVWVGVNGRVLGYWHGRPETSLVHYPRRPVSLVLEYVPGSALPGVGSLLTLVPRPCSNLAAL